MSHFKKINECGNVGTAKKSERERRELRLTVPPTARVRKSEKCESIECNESNLCNDSRSDAILN